MLLRILPVLMVSVLATACDDMDASKPPSSSLASKLEKELDTSGCVPQMRTLYREVFFVDGPRNGHPAIVQIDVFDPAFIGGKATLVRMRRQENLRFHDARNYFHASAVYEGDQFIILSCGMRLDARSTRVDEMRWLAHLGSRWEPK